MIKGLEYIPSSDRLQKVNLLISSKRRLRSWDLIIVSYLMGEAEV